MAQDSPKSGTPGAIWALVLLGVGGISGYLYFKAPLHSTRPEAPPTEFPRLPGARILGSDYSRLYQDPFDTAHKRRYPPSPDPRSPNGDELRKPGLKQATPREFLRQSRADQVDQLRRFFKEVVEKNTGDPDKSSRLHCLMVLVPGEPYAADREQRRRTRYAVLSALGSHHFRLSFGKRMSYADVPVRIELVRLQIPIDGF